MLLNMSKIEGVEIQETHKKPLMTNSSPEQQRHVCWHGVGKRCHGDGALARMKATQIYVGNLSAESNDIRRSGPVRSMVQQHPAPMTGNDEQLLKAEVTRRKIAEHLIVKGVVGVKIVDTC